jgi:hypothetical protein
MDDGMEDKVRDWETKQDALQGISLTLRSLHHIHKTFGV